MKPIREGEAERQKYQEYFKNNKFFRKDLIKVEKYVKGAPAFMKRGEIGMATQMLRDIKFVVNNVLEEIANELKMPHLKDHVVKEGKIQVQGLGMYDDKTLKKKIVKLASELHKNAKKGNWNKASENGIRALGRMWGAYQDWARTNEVNEATYKLRRGSTASDLDELDAELARMKILGKPDFSKLTYTIDKTKLPFKKARHLDMLLKGMKAKKVHEAATPENKPSYYKGLSKKDKDERERVIKRRSKMDSDDPDAYKGFKSDKGVKTKPSKYTAKFKKMYGELSEEQKAVVHEKIAAKTKKALKNKAKKANAPLGALTQVYNKGLAAWRTGHRPGASQHAWAMGRVNSFLTGGKARKVDSAQWNKVKKHRKK